MTEVSQHIYTQEFNFLNDTNFAETDLFCNKCKKILKSRIYTELKTKDEGEETNLCEECYESDNSDVRDNLIENHFLRRKLSQLKFLCPFIQCDYVGVLGDALEHDKLVCNSKLLFCIFDNQQFENVHHLSEHLLSHNNVRKVHFDSHSITFNLNALPEGKEIILTNYKRNYIFVFIEKKKNSISIGVAHQLLEHNGPTIKSFTVVQGNENAQIRQRGEIQSLHTVLYSNDSMNSLKLITSIDNGGVITVYFVNCMNMYHVKINDCPICFNQMSGNLKLCITGHAVCTSCASKITTCPICRLQMTYNLNLQYIFSSGDLRYTCENYNQGCLETENLQIHRQMCSYRKIACPGCQTKIEALDFYNHFISKHSTLNNFTESQVMVTETTTSMFVQDRLNIFCIDAILDTNLNVKFTVKLLNFTEFSNTNFKFKIILFRGDDVVSEVGGKLESNSHTVSISLSSFEPPLHTVVGYQNSLNLKCKYNIFKYF